MVADTIAPCPALGLSVVFVRLWGVKTVLLVGTNKWQLQKRPRKRFLLAWRRYRRARRSLQSTVRLGDIIGAVDRDTRDEIEAAKVYMAAISIMLQEKTMAEAPHDSKGLGLLRQATIRCG